MKHVADGPHASSTVQRYTPEELSTAKQAMLDELVAISGGTLLRGCCTQDCCDTGGCPDGLFPEPLVT